MLLRDTTEKRHKGAGGRVSGIRRLISISFVVFFLLAPDTRPLMPVYAQQPAQQKQPQQKQEGAQQKSLEEERMNILKGDIQKEVEEYKKLKKEYSDIQKAQEERGQENLVKIAKMFESMAAEDAAKKIEKLDEETAVLILGSLKPKIAGKILAQIEDEKAASLSKKILFKAPPPREKNSQ